MGKNYANMGIENDDEIVIYDNSDVISSCRCWYNFIYFGHDPKLVHVLDGGFKKWKMKIRSQMIIVITKIQLYKAKEKKLVKNKKQIDENINIKNLMLLMQEVEKDLREKLLNQEKV